MIFFRGSLLAIFAAAPLLAAGATGACAQSSETSAEIHAIRTAAVAAVQPAASAVSKPYYVEFRARSAQSYGHTFLIHGRLNGNKIATKTVAGLHPFTESAVPWMVGHLVLVPSETGASDGDTEDQYVTARFRVALTADEYKRVTAYIKDLQKNSPVWHAVLYNCNAFVGDIARFMGMDTPISTLLMPADYIDGLRDLNISKQRTAGSIGTPVGVPSAEKLREEALKTIEQQQKRTVTASTRNVRPQQRVEAGHTAPTAAAVAPHN